MAALAVAATCSAAERPTSMAAGPLHTLTVATNSLAESRLFYETGLGLTVEGPLSASAEASRTQRGLWDVPDDLGWSTYVLRRPGVEAAAQIRLLVLDRASAATRTSWSPATVGPFTIGFPNTRQEALDRELRRLGFGALNALERSPFRADDGREYEILETVHTGPDFVCAVGVARGVGQPSITPVDAQGMGGPGYSMMIVPAVEPMVRFLEEGLGFTVKSQRVWKSTGTRGALNVPDGTEFDFAQLVPAEGSHGFFILIAFRNLAMDAPVVPPRLPHRGLVLYSLPVPLLDAALERVVAAGATAVRGPLHLDAPGIGAHRFATVLAPNGVMFELFERVAAPSR